jgi:membrane protease YdiL (CAAX protease family)
MNKIKYFKVTGLIVGLLFTSIFLTSSLWYHPAIKLSIGISVLIVWILLIILLLIVKYGEKESFTSLGSLKINLKTVGLGLLITISLFIASSLFMLLWLKVLHIPIIQEQVSQRVLSLPFIAKILLSISAGITEETICRGYCITRLYQLTKNKPVSIVIPMFLDAIDHVGYGTLQHVLVAFVMGGVLIFFYLKFKSLIANIIGHALFDFLSMSFQV